ncbi:MAG: putative nucleotidyltransferase substrate binding domain-containing protein [Thermaceae bacterium]
MSLDLPESLLRVLKNLGKVQTHPEGEVLLKEEGTPSERFFLILAGRAGLYRNSVKAMDLLPGEFFGLPSLLTGTPPVFTVKAEAPLEVLALPKEALPLLLEDPETARRLFESLAERMGHREISHLLLRPAKTLLRRPPLSISRKASVQEAAQKMREARVSSLLLEGSPPGIVTDRDLRNRALAQGLPPSTPVEAIASFPLLALPAFTPLYEALAFMVERGIHHLPLLEEGRVVGVITHTDVLEAQVQTPLFLLKRIERLELSQYGQEVARLVERLFEEGFPPLEIGNLVASLNDALIRRLLKEAEAKLGPPPFPYTFIVFGSEGRKEQALLTDQDNALVLAQEGGEEYFQALAQEVVGGLHRAGFPYCKGGYMATRHRRSLKAWLEVFRTYLRTPEPQALLEAQIFFDFRPVYGTVPLDPLEQLVQEEAQRGVFLYHLARASLAFRPPLGFLGRIQTSKGQVDLKRGGIAPIVSLARLYGLLSGSQGRGTLLRLKAAVEKGVLNPRTAEALGEAYAFLFGLRLKHQLQALREGRPPSNEVELRRLTPREEKQLKEAFGLIAQVQEYTMGRFQIQL